MNGWSNCGCIGMDVTASGVVTNTGGCSPNWGLLACAAVAAFVAITISGKKKA